MSRCKRINRRHEARRLSELEIAHLKRDMGVLGESDLIDFESIVDMTLTHHEMKYELCAMFKIPDAEHDIAALDEICNEYNVSRHVVCDYDDISEPDYEDVYGCPEEFGNTGEDTWDDDPADESPQKFDVYFRIDSEGLWVVRVIQHGTWDEQPITEATKFLDGQSYAIHKVPRAGFTTSFAIAAERAKKKVLLVCPTNRIRDGTLKGIADIVGIRGNAACRYNQELIKRDPIWKSIPLSLHRGCGPNCKFFKGCSIQEIDQRPDARLFAMTNAKLTVITFNNTSSSRSRLIRDSVRDVDVVMIDESHTISTGGVAMLPIATHFLDLNVKISGYPTLKKAIERWTDLRRSAERQEDDLWAETEAQWDSWLVRELQVPATVSVENCWKIYGEIWKLVENRVEMNVSDKEIIDLVKAVEILSCNQARLTYIKTNGSPVIYIAGSLGKNEIALHRFLTEVAPKAAVVFVSGTQFEATPGRFAKIANREIIEAEFPDFKHANRTMSIYCDSWRFGTKNLEKGYTATIDRIVTRINAILDEEKDQKVMIVALNKRLAFAIQARIKRENVETTWYRSDKVLGTESDCRVMIAVGVAEKPYNASDAETNGFIESQTLRQNETDASTWQAWSRAKDPAGIVESRVYCIGIKEKRVNDIVTWGVGRCDEVDGKGRVQVYCDKPFELPKIKAAYTEHIEHPSQRKETGNLERVWKAEDGEQPENLKVISVNV